MRQCDAVPPPLLRYKVSESTDIRLFLDVGQRIATAIERAIDDAGVPMNQMKRVLDFGCGCGRTLAWLISRFPNTQFFGADIDSMSVQWCREHLRGSFCCNQDAPPLSYADAEFDCIYAISVFTHIDERYQLEWLAEFRRVLRPGGLLLVSVHGVGTAKGLRVEERATLRAQGILFKRSSKLRGIHPDFYHTTFQTKDYVLQKWSRFFDIVDYKQLGLGYQDLIVLRRGWGGHLAGH
jgi:cyclopropane fatty-acyl-phospholipid synthase-like methyltransferase